MPETKFILLILLIASHELLKSSSTAINNRQHFLSCQFMADVIKWPMVRANNEYDKHHLKSQTIKNSDNLKNKMCHLECT